MPSSFRKRLSPARAAMGTPTMSRIAIPIRAKPSTFMTFLIRLLQTGDPILGNFEETFDLSNLILAVSPGAPGLCGAWSATVVSKSGDGGCGSGLDIGGVMDISLLPKPALARCISDASEAG